MKICIVVTDVVMTLLVSAKSVKVCFFLFFFLFFFLGGGVLFFIKISKLALPDVMLKYERGQYRENDNIIFTWGHPLNYSNVIW